MGKYCRNCGHELGGDVRFCGKCGTSVLAAPAPAPERAAAPSSGPADLPPVAPVPAPAAPVTELPGDRLVKSGKKRGAVALPLALGLLLLAQLAVVALYGWPGFALQDRFKQTAVVDGSAELSGMSVDFRDSDYELGVLENRRTASVDLDEGQASAGYELAFSEPPEGTVVLSAPLPEGFTLAEEEAFYLDVGFSMIDETGEAVMVYDHVEAVEEEGQILAEITPTAYDGLENSVALSNGGYVQPLHPDRMRFDAQFKVKLVKASQSERFKLIFDQTRLMFTSLTEEMIADTLSRMEQVYGQMDAFGFDMSRRTAWPMDIHVTPLGGPKDSPIYGQYVSSWWGINRGYMNLSRLLFTNFDLEMTTSVFGHELTHFIQECYVSTQYKRLHWLDEATAVFFERYFGGETDHSARQYELCEGLFPPSDSARDGYVRGALVAYWAQREGWLEGQGNMSGLISLYSPGGYLGKKSWRICIEGRTGEPAGYALDFFTRMALNDEAVWAGNGYAPYVLHQFIVDKKDKRINQFAGELKLLAGELTGEEGQLCSLQVPAYGVRMVALTMTESEAGNLEEEGALSIDSLNGETLVLLKAYSKDVDKTEGAKISAPLFRERLQEKHRYLLLVVNTTETKREISFTLRAEPEEEEEEEEEIVGDVGKEGEYAGTYIGTHTELRKDSGHYGRKDPVTVKIEFDRVHDGRHLYSFRYGFHEAGEGDSYLESFFPRAGGFAMPKIKGDRDRIDVTFTPDKQTVRIDFRIGCSEGEANQTITATRQ